MVDVSQRPLTFLFTDIEGSSRLWERFPAPMARALARHDELLHQHAGTCRGHVFKTVGDAFCIAFEDPVDGVKMAQAAQQALAAESWQGIEPLRIRLGLHTGLAEKRDSDYFGPTLNRVARIMGAGHGGQSLLSQATAELISDRLPDGVTLKKLGAARLRNLDNLIDIFQVTFAGLPDDFPPLRALEATPNNLPNQASTFVGRERELEQLRALAREHQMVTLTGPGGTGKTRLAIEAAHSLLGSFPDGVWLIELATLSDPDLLIETVVDAIGLRGQPDQTLLRTLTEFLKGRSAVLLLDNCEHLIGDLARLCQQLLRQAPRLHIIATSRSPLAIAGEHVLPVPTMSLPAAWGGRLSGSRSKLDYVEFEAVQLFVDRAAAASPGFALTDENAPLIARICWRLDGIPHAIELAAARVRLLSLEQILTRIDDRFRLLGRKDAAALPHQQTLRTTIDWSFDMLSEAEKALLLRLSVFGRGRSLEAIEEVCSGDPVEEWDLLDLLGQLVDKSLISMEPDATGKPRYYLLESLWEYAREKLEASGEMETIRDRHLHYFARMAETAAPHLEGPDQAQWLSDIAEEHGNLRLAIEWACQSPQQGEAGLRLMGKLTRYWEVRSRQLEGREHLQNLLALPAAQGRHALRAQALGGAGRLAWCCDDDADSRVFYTEAIEIYQELGDEPNAALLTAFMGFVERNEGNPEAAKALFDQSYTIAKRLQQPRILVVAISGQGTLAADRGDFAEAIKLKEEAISIFRDLGDRWILALISWSMARVCISAGDFERASRLLREQATIVRELGNRWILPYIVEGFARIALQQREPGRAATLLGASQAALTNLGLGLSVPERREHEADLASLREQLGPEEIQTRLAEGSLYTLDEAMDEALRGP